MRSEYDGYGILARGRGECESGGYGKVFGIDQQGGKGNASFTDDGTMPTILSGSHGTPHAVAFECWAWKHRQLMSNPKREVADPVTRTDYKDPDMVGWYEE